MPKADRRLIFIASYGRSGSTLLDRLLGGSPAAVSVGELCHLWGRAGLQDQLCGCGAPFSACPFWSSVVTELFPGDRRAAFQEVLAWQRAVNRQVHLGPLLAPALRPKPFARTLASYLEILDRLLAAIVRQAGRPVVVDSSKNPIQAVTLRQVPALPVHLVHLVRDSRAVAYSWQRRRLRPEIHWEKSFMPVWGPLKSSLQWLYVNAIFLRLGPRMASRHLVRYEDLAARPQATVAGLAQALSIPEPVVFTGPDRCRFGVDHTVSGNPARFQQGEVVIRPDEDWRTGLAPRHRLLVLLLTWPYLFRFGYLGGRQG
ncbi:MAG: sulfotransferase [Thermodesulfobacteriota bacterium]